MKVLVCVRRLDKGGAEMLECRLAQCLNTMGIETHVLAQYGRTQFNGEEASKQWIAKGISAIFFFNSENGPGIVKSFFQLFRLLRYQKYDVIITSNSGIDTIIGVMKLFFRFKQVIAFHTYINKRILDKNRIKLWAYFVRKANGYYSITDYVRKNIESTLHIKSTASVTIYNSINPLFLETSMRASPQSIREMLSLPPEAKIILLAGRIEARKGFDLALEHLQQLLTQPDIYMVIAGEAYSGSFLEEGLYGFAANFESKIKHMGLQGKIVFLGYVEDLKVTMQQADVYVHLARHEGFGLVLLEAIAAKVPIVASNVGGIPEVLNNTPYIPFGLEDSDGICRQVNRFLTMHAKEKSEIVNKAYEVLPYYTDGRRANEIRNFLNQLNN